MASEAFEPIAFLRAVGLHPGGDLRAKPLSGGYLNAVFRLRGEGLDWVVKRFAVDLPPSLYPNLPEAEYLALQRLSPLQAAPRPVAFFPGDAPVLVYEFFAGEEWSGDLAAVADLLRRIRRADISGFRNVPMQPRDILDQAEIFVAHCSVDLRDRLRAARPEPVAVPEVARGVIHTDLGPGNLIAGADGLIAIDWQCPAAGDPVEDLVAFLSPAFPTASHPGAPDLGPLRWQAMARAARLPVAALGGLDGSNIGRLTHGHGAAAISALA